jgi:hypothetical protein
MHEGNVKVSAKVVLMSAIVLIGTGVGAAEESNLYEASVSDVATSGGEKVAVTFKEIERSPLKSVVELSALAGGSVSGPMLIVKFMCGLTRARGEQFFASRLISRSPMRFEVTFPKTGPTPSFTRDSKPPDSNVFSLAQCDLLKF